MTKAIATLLNPARAEGESREKYRERRNQANEYVSSSLMGTLFWNTAMQGTYINPHRANRPVGKSGRRMAKKLARIAREKIATGSMADPLVELNAQSEAIGQAL